MRCRDVEKLCTGYVDGELSDGMASALRGHLRTCPACLDRVEDEASVRDAAADLDPLDPPAELWAGIQSRLAEAEITDARRPRVWLWWQGLRQHALPAAVAVAAVVALLVWNSRRGQQLEPRPGAVAEQAATDRSPSARLQPAANGERFLEARQREVREADGTYASTIAELKSLVAEERAVWSQEVAKAFDSRLAALDESARQHQRRLALNQSHDPRTRDALYAIYRAQIGLMQRVVLEGVIR